MRHQDEPSPVSPFKQLSRRLQRFLKRAKHRVTASWQPGRYSVADRVVQCDHCQAELFRVGMVQMQVTSGHSTFGWSRRQGCVLVCENCGRMHWFLKRPEKLEDELVATRDQQDGSSNIEDEPLKPAG